MGWSSFHITRSIWSVVNVKYSVPLYIKTPLIKGFINACELLIRLLTLHKPFINSSKWVITKFSIHLARLRCYPKAKALGGLFHTISHQTVQHHSSQYLPLPLKTDAVLIVLIPCSNIARTVYNLRNLCTLHIYILQIYLQFTVYSILFYLSLSPLCCYCFFHCTALSIWISPKGYQ